MLLYTFSDSHRRLNIYYFVIRKCAIHQYFKL
nr:MAG TPA: hypothetical protein [Caudoviricetes sp.]